MSNTYNGVFVSHEAEEESFIFFSEDMHYDYYCRIRKSEFEKFALKRVMGSKVENITLRLPTSIGKGSPAWAKGLPIYHQIALCNCTFMVTCKDSAPFSGTFDMQWHIRIYHG